ncbi:uncharacterized protein [Onthophagus taurus]|uniref:uncharacterized protein n=1 Tax=Onthophagus taurus TaxID=166361 RepID=UPI0039BE2B64
MQLTGFGGGQNKVLCNEKVCVRLMVDEVFVNGVEVFVVPDDAQNVAMIIGRSFTERPEIAYARVGEELVFGWKDTLPFKDFQIPESKKTTVMAEKDAIVKAGVMNLIMAETQCGEYLIVPIVNERQEDFVLEKGMTIAEIRGSKVAGVRMIKRNEPTRVTDAMINCDGDESVRNELVELCNEFRGCFALSVDELGCTNKTEMDIKDSGNPVRKKPYRASFTEREKMKGILKEWREAGLVTQTTSPYASPCLLVTKRSGEPRLVVDYRALNQQTEKASFPLPSLDEQFVGLSGCRLFSQLDLGSAYLQIPLTESTKQKTAFVTLDKTGQF